MDFLLGGAAGVAWVEARKICKAPRQKGIDYVPVPFPQQASVLTG